MLATLFMAQAARAADRGPIDLTQDDNGNQISDAVEKEVAILQTLSSEKERSLEIKAFVEQLPISERSKELQLRAGELLAKLPTASQEEAQVLLQEYADISAELQQDPVIAKAENDIRIATGNNIGKSAVAPNAPSYGSLKKGDIMATRSSTPGIPWLWTMTYSHTGNFYGPGKVYESNGNLFGPSEGVKIKLLSGWQSPGKYVGLARNNKKSATTMSSAVNWAYTKYKDNGKTPYNFNFINKGTDLKLYCSQLSWKINKQAGTDIDSNAWQYQLWVAAVYGNAIINALIIPAVAPDEVMLDSDVTVYSKGWN
jgi:uncharacterized protein YycO